MSQYFVLVGNLAYVFLRHVKTVPCIVRLFVLTLFATLQIQALSAPSTPNVLLIVSDDQGYRDLGCFGSSEIKTPHLDRLASGGVKLTNFYVTWPACTPSRGSLLTGRYPQRNGTYDMYRNEAPDYDYEYQPAEYRVTFQRIGGMDTCEILLPNVLKQAGIASGIYGKWDLGVHRRFLPPARGFDDFYGFVNTGIDYYTHERYGVPSMYRNNSPTVEDKGTYSTFLFQREAMSFLSENKTDPFFLYVPFNAPHSASNLDRQIRSTVQAPEAYKALYPEPGQPEFTTRTVRGKTVKVPTREVRRRNYMAAVTCMDDAIGEMLDFLDQNNLNENTLVIFLSDNGGGGASNNEPLRGGKGQMFEGGIRVPCIVRWPGKIPSGTICSEFLTSLEIFPAICAATGVQPSKNIVLDGFDLLPVLQGKTPSPRTEMFWQRRADKAARVGNYKWVDSGRGSGLFDLSKDIGEEHDLSSEKPEIAAMIKARFVAWQKTMDDAEPRGPFKDF